MFLFSGLVFRFRFSFFFFNDTATTEIYTLSLHDALPITAACCSWTCAIAMGSARSCSAPRSEEHTSELQSREELVCRLLLDKKKKEVGLRPNDINQNRTSPLTFETAR